MDGMNLFGSGEKEKKRNLIHYVGEIGVFDYDPKEFEIIDALPIDYLHYCGNGRSVNLPDGCTSTRFMFSNCKLPEGFSLGERFNTSKVTNMQFMFHYCELPEGFFLGEHFDTSNVIYIRGMFSGCRYGGASIYDYFNTESDSEIVEKLHGLRCSLADSLLLVIDMQNVYSKGGAWECQNYEVALENILRILKSQDYYDVIFTQHLAAKNPSGVWSKYNKQYADINVDRSLNEIDYRLLSFQDRYIYNKSVYSAYSIDKVRVEAACTGKVIVTGVVAECCVLSTVMDLIDAGVYVIYLKDAIAGVNNETEAATLKILEGLAPLHLSIMSTDEYLGVLKNNN